MAKFLFGLILIVYMIIIWSDALGQQSEDQNSGLIPSVGSLTLEVTGSTERSHHDQTNVTVIKAVQPNEGRLKFVYDIKTPEVNDFHFVLALDSSGSLKTSPDSEQAKAIIYAVPIFINETIKNYPKKNFNVSIVSWDDDIDFAYNRFNNKDAKMANMVKIQTAAKDLAHNNVFQEVNDTRYFYRCDEKDHTNLSIALESAIDILDRSPPINYHNTSNFTIIVTGESEFYKCNPDLIKNAREKGYSVYIIQMEPSEEDSEMLAHLKQISGSEEKVLSCHARGSELNTELLMHLENALKKAVSEPVAEDVKIVEPLYGYLMPGEGASVEILKLPNSLTQVIPEERDNNTVVLQLPYGLFENNTTRVMFNANFVFDDLPVSVTKNSKPVVFAPPDSNAYSNISYTWLKKHNISFELTPNSVKLRSPNLEKTSKGQESTNERAASIRNLERPSTLANDTLGLMTLLSFVIMLLIMRPKN